MNVVSMFDGISCGMVALERAGITVGRYVAYEIEQNAIKISQKNYPQIEHCGDVTKADFTKYQGFDLVIAGSPCQGFSIAGEKLNFEDPRSKLYFEFERALKEIRPKYFFLENVAMKPEWADFISHRLGVKGVNINSKLVSAQSRNRTYWTNIEFEKDVPDRGITLQSILEFGETKRQKSKTVRVGGAGSGWGNKHEWDMPNDSRVYTTVELERLQTLPDNYTSGVGEVQRRKCIGNCWTVDVIAHIFTGLKEGV
jgi:DNA (cytosine-5)-methyltransferase 3A